MIKRLNFINKKLNTELTLKDEIKLTLEYFELVNQLNYDELAEFYKK